MKSGLPCRALLSTLARVLPLRSVFVFAVTAQSLLTASLANAGEGDVQVAALLGVGVPDGATVGPALLAVGSYGVLDFMDLDGAVSFSTLHGAPGADSILSSRIGPTFKADIARLVPSAGVTLGAYGLFGGSANAGVGSPAGGYFGGSAHWGADYIISREFSFTARIEHNLLATSPDVSWVHLFLAGLQYQFD